jgi:hypothetical protein
MAMTMFVIKVSRDENVPQYQTQLLISSAPQFLLNMRYMVQEYLLGGIVSSMTADKWLAGFDADFFDIVSQGDFYAGNDYDLIKKVTPLDNTNVEAIFNAE